MKRRTLRVHYKHSAASGNHADLASSHPADVRAISRTARLKLGNGLQRKLKAHRHFHKCVIEPGSVHAVETKIVVLLGEAAKPDLVLCAGTGADRPRNQSLQARPVSAVHWEFLSLRAGDHSANLGISQVQIGYRGLYRDVGTDGTKR